MTDISEQLERHFLPFVEKPDRYTGSEPGLPEFSKSPALRVALAFPDLYELGMSYQGLRILYHLANAVEGVNCERVFMPWFDATARLKSLNFPLLTLESKIPLHRFDLLGINLQYELHASNALAMLELGGIPLFAAERGEEAPIVLGGGPLAFHPEPFAPFFDAIAVGDGEDIFPEILTVLKEGKQRGKSRKAILRSLGDITGVYLPGYYVPEYSKSGEYKGLRRTDAALPTTIQARVTPVLLPEHYPGVPIVPNLETTHNRLVVEIARGCSRGCRFCGPGMTHRPVRERPVADILSEARNGLERTGYSELSLLSLSTADYRYLESLLGALRPLLKHHRSTLSFPSLRPDLFTPQMADHAASESRTGLTFAPEAATPRLRSVINKETSDEALLKAATLAYERGWKALKLYFMIGLPTETDDDITGMIDLIQRVESICKSFRAHKLNVSISPFSPKPHTPFECETQQEPGEIRRRLSLLKTSLSRNRLVNLEIHSPNVSRIEAAISRGDRRGAEVIHNAYRDGALFDAWTDGFSAQRWDKAFSQAGLDLKAICGKMDQTKPLPWDHIATGVTREFLLDEGRASAAGIFTPDCRVEGCNLCGLEQHPDFACPEVSDLPVDVPDDDETVLASATFLRYRLTYRRGGGIRFCAHLDVMGIFKRALQRLGVPLEFTQGFKPHIRLVSSPPVAVGLTSAAEYLEFGLGGEWESGLQEALQASLPTGINVIHVAVLPPHQPSIGALNVFLYRAVPLDLLDTESCDERISSLLAAEQIPLQRNKAGKSTMIDARATLWRLERDGNSVYIGLKSSGGPTARAAEILALITPENEGAQIPSTAQIMADWRIERTGMWWEVDGMKIDPSTESAMNLETKQIG
jgi:radical SAM family uncharacterized protein/radical SAM-linked protein